MIETKKNNFTRKEIEDAIRKSFILDKMWRWQFSIYRFKVNLGLVNEK